MSGTQRCTLAWPIRSWICLSNMVIIGIGSAIPPYTPLSEIVPPRRTSSIAAYRAPSRSKPTVSIIFAATRVRQQPGDLVRRAVPTGDPCASMPTASITESGPRPPVRSAHHLGEVLAVLVEVEGR